MKRKVYLLQVTLFLSFFTFFFFSLNLIAQGFNLGAEFIVSDLETYDNLGSSISMSESGNYAILSAKNKAVNGIYGTGTAYIFKRNSNGNWFELKKMLVQTPEQYANFSTVLSISDEYAIVGTIDKSVGGINYVGMVYIFKKDEGGVDNWGLIKEMTPPTPVVVPKEDLDLQTFLKSFL